MDFLEQLARSSLWLPAFFLFGISVGSFLNVYAWRYPQMMEQEWATDICQWFEEKGWSTPATLFDMSKSKLSLAYPRSYCPHCKTPIPFYYNIPILGYLLLKGKAACCKQPISIKYPLYELITGLVSLWIGYFFQSTPWQAIFYLVVFWFFMGITLIDIDSMLIPDAILAPLGLLILSVLLMAPHLVLTEGLEQSLSGALIGFLSLYGIRILGFVLFKKEAMGMADPKLLAIIGLLTGPIPLIPVLLIASIGALFVALIQRIGTSTPLPFGPFLCLGGAIVMFNPSYFKSLLIGF